MESNPPRPTTQVLYKGQQDLAHGGVRRKPLSDKQVAEAKRFCGIMHCTRIMDPMGDKADCFSLFFAKNSERNQKESPCLIDEGGIPVV